MRVVCALLVDCGVVVDYTILMIGGVVGVYCYVDGRVWLCVGVLMSSVWCVVY